MSEDNDSSISIKSTHFNNFSDFKDLNFLSGTDNFYYSAEDDPRQFEDFDDFSKYSQVLIQGYFDYLDGVEEASKVKGSSGTEWNERFYDSYLDPILSVIVLKIVRIMGIQKVRMAWVKEMLHRFYDRGKDSEFAFLVLSDQAFQEGIA